MIHAYQSFNIIRKILDKSRRDARDLHHPYFCLDLYCVTHTHTNTNTPATSTVRQKQKVVPLYWIRLTSFDT